MANLRAAPARTRTCFHEANPAPSLARRALAEALGTLLLVLAIAGCGLVSNAVYHTSSQLALLVGAIATGSALAALIVAFGAVSGGHFNPLISTLQWLTGERKLTCSLVYVFAQICGGAGGALLANVLFGTDRTVATPPHPWRLGMSEIAATSALLIVVFSCARSGQRESGPFAVGAWIAAASLATPSASLANPAIALAAIVASGPLALPGWLGCIYLLAECAGALIALPAIQLAYPREHVVATLRGQDGDDAHLSS